MKLTKYLRDKLYSIVIFICSLAIVVLLLSAFKTDKALVVVITVLSIFTYVTLLLFDFARRKNFYDTLIANIEHLDKAYLVTSTLSKPSFYEGELYIEALYEITKSMNERVHEIEKSMTDFKEYLELWVHEVKLPISSCELTLHNNPDLQDKRIVKAIKKIERCVEEVLYYTRQETSEKDYLIKKVDLKTLINRLAINFKDDFLANNIELVTKGLESSVYTDSKWLEFILGQIVNNSIKYKKEGAGSRIVIASKEDEKVCKLIIEDNGLGIKEEDLPRVFEKSFTGHNGHNHAKSTGMGLYIAKNLLAKLGCDIICESESGKYTRVTIFFPKNEYYEVSK